MPTNVPVPAVTVGQVYTTTLYENYLRQNMNKLLNQAHRVLTVAQFAALTGPEGTKGVVAPDEVYLEVDATNGIQWHLAYESGETTYKWRFLGGPPLWVQVATAEPPGSTGAWVDLTTPVTLTLPRGGDYDVVDGHCRFNNASGAGNTCDMQIWLSTTSGLSLAGSAFLSTNSRQSIVTTGRLTGRAASDVLRQRYNVNTSVSCSIDSRSFGVTPSRIS